MPTKPGSVRPTAQLVAARLVAGLVDPSDLPGDAPQVRRFKEMLRRDPMAFEKFLKELERDMRLGKRNAMERVEAEKSESAAAVKVAVAPVEADGGTKRCLALVEEWLKENGVKR